MGSNDNNKKDDSKKKQEEKKKSETVILKVQFHCSQCVKRVRKAVASISGVESISVDEKQGKVTVIGQIDAKKVLKRVKKTGKHVELLQPKETKDSSSNNNKQAKDSDDKGSSKDKDSAKEKEGGNKDNNNNNKKSEADNNKSKSDYIITRVAHNDFTYVFSDENPNSCSIM